MNHARAGELPAAQFDEVPWFRSVDERHQYDPPLFRPSRSRFNPGHLQVMYFAPDPLVARFEARDVLGQWFGDAIPSLRDRQVVVEYRILLGPQALIVDARPTHLAAVETTVQEMTGDWQNYDRRGMSAPTQNLASAVFGRRDSPMGLMAPSARNPLKDNLILFAERLPPRSVSYHAQHVWHESQLAARR
ncbi:MAG: RES family NAD+ phosphorylase [Gammaproteobacteria bacterium]|nr:RES family NAD+ phosphorylase [Gammaproteobacteria bacterium]MDE0273596.1 RES family NAD+ phosphorylase [Gammaproteobacteria bacterium]